MPLKFKCSCGKQVQAPDSMAGKRAKCPACGEVLQVPQRLDPLLRDCLEEGLAEPAASDLLTGKLPVANGPPLPALRSAANTQHRRQVTLQPSLILRTLVGVAAIGYGAGYGFLSGRGLFLMLRLGFRPWLSFWGLVGTILAVVQLFACLLLAIAGLGIFGRVQGAVERASLASKVLIGALALNVLLGLFHVVRFSVAEANSEFAFDLFLKQCLVAGRDVVVPLLILWWCHSPRAVD